MKALVLCVIRAAGRAWCRLQGAEVHSSAFIHGFPRIIKKTGATIRIGPGVTINAAGWSNFHNDGRRTVLHAAPSALIDLHANCGISSSRIIAHKSVTIGESSLVGANCLICDSDMHEIPLGSFNPVRKESIQIGRNVFIGVSATILKGTKIGDGAVIGACSVVCGEIPKAVMAAGNPARQIRDLSPV